MPSGPLLRLHDGFEHTSPHLNSEVKRLQTALNQQGFSLVADGRFDRETETAVRRFQRQRGLQEDGVVGPATWAALTAEPLPQAGQGFATTYVKSDAALARQLEEIKKYRAVIEKAASKYDVPPALIAGIGSRESHWGLALNPLGPGGTGDRTARRAPARFRTGPLPPDNCGFGRGLMQIDFDAHDFARTGNWQDPESNICYGVTVLCDARSMLRRKTTLGGTALLRAAVAAYNCGAGNVLNAIRNGYDVDFFTAGRDYSRDALSRAGWFQLHGWDLPSRSTSTSTIRGKQRGRIAGENSTHSKSGGKMRRRSRPKPARDLFAPASEPKRTIVGIKVKFELNSKNGLRRVIFGLEKSSQGDDVLWKINFALFEREKKSDPYGDALVDMDIDVDTQLNKKAEDTAHKGLTPGQAAHALGPAAEDAKAAAAGDIDHDEASDTVQATLRKK
jgi:putative peptidoglycan binding protein/transglycosylase-like protein with SLT domain